MSNVPPNEDHERSSGVTSSNQSPTSANLEPLRSNEIDLTAACNPIYGELPKRHASFAAWPHGNLPSVDNLVRAGFFYTGTEVIVTCFYCNGSLQNWGPNDNPMIEHARWFPQCAYAKKLYDDEMYRKIQEAKRAQQERALANEAKEKENAGIVSNTNSTTNNRLLIPDENTLSRLVAARLDLSISQHLLDPSFKLSIIKRFWEDQLRFKEDNFVFDSDLRTACLNLQKQCDLIRRKNENMTAPNMKIKRIFQRIGHSKNESSKSDSKKMQQSSFQYVNPHMKVEELNPTSIKDPGVYSASCMAAAGFKYTGNGDTALCNDCKLEVSNWTLDTDPITIHSEQSPDCQFVRSRKISSLSGEPSSVSLSPVSKRKILTQSETENSSKRQKIPTMDADSLLNGLLMAHLLPTIHQETFSHWPHRTSPSSAQMIEAGFFNCNVGDRVICICCDLICQQWTPTDDPCEVHKTISPECLYVKAKLIRPSAPPVTIINENPTEITSVNHSPTSSNVQPVGRSGVVYTATQNAIYADLPKRQASFATWPRGNLSSIDDLVRAGFFYTGEKTIVSCFYCNGALQNWGPTDNPMVEHARWFSHCAYAKQLCGDEMYRKIQESKRAQQERARANEAKERTTSGVVSNTNITTNNPQLLIPDESTLSRLVAARLDLPISQRLLDQGFKLSIIKRCWEDQLRLKHDDFLSENDLYMAYFILQKQIKHIDGKKENIVIPAYKMKYIREYKNKERNETNFTEERTKTIDREKLLKDWPHSLPSRLAMLLGGWLLDTKKGKDFTICPYCGVECDNWEQNDDPLRIHRSWSPYCPFILADQSIYPSSEVIKGLGEVYTNGRIKDEAVISMSNVILISDSPYAQAPKREESFDTFPARSSTDVNALVKSGFYYIGKGSLLRCYECGGLVNDFHQYPSNEIDIRHYNQYRDCRLARMLYAEINTKSTILTNKCGWCLMKPKELSIDPCNHLAVCQDCAKLINTCPICGEIAKTFYRIFNS